jgi:hypothetical protein
MSLFHRSFSPVAFLLLCNQCIAADTSEVNQFPDPLCRLCRESAYGKYKKLCHGGQTCLLETVIATFGYEEIKSERPFVAEVPYARAAAKSNKPYRENRAFVYTRQDRNKATERELVDTG